MWSSCGGCSMVTSWTMVVVCGGACGPPVTLCIIWCGLSVNCKSITSVCPSNLAHFMSHLLLCYSTYIVLLCISFDRRRSAHPHRQVNNANATYYNIVHNIVLLTLLISASTVDGPCDGTILYHEIKRNNRRLPMFSRQEDVSGIDDMVVSM